jgi:hypothetical protein
MPGVDYITALGTGTGSNNGGTYTVNNSQTVTSQTITGTATAITYVAYTLDPATRAFFKSDSLWMTAPFTLFGILRFLMLVSGKAGAGKRAESPTQDMLRDMPFVLNLVLWVVVVVAVVVGMVAA